MYFKNLNLNKMAQKILACLLSFIMVFSLNRYLSDSNPAFSSNSILNILSFCAILYLLGKALTLKDTIVIKYAIITASLLGLMLVFGASISKHNDMREIFGSPSSFLYSTLYFIGFTALFYIGLVHLFSFAKNKGYIPGNSKDKAWFGANLHSFFICWFLLFLSWLPCFFAYYPSLFAYDIENQAQQVFGLLPYINNHPILHTLFVGIFLKIGDATGSNLLGAVLHSITQMLCLSASFSYALYYLAKIKLHFYARIGIFLYFALHPFHAIFSIITSKDVLFTIFFVLLFMKLTDMLLDPESFFHSKKKCITFVIITFFFLALRNNAFYAFLAFIPFLFLHLKKYWKGLSIVVACCIGLNLLYGVFLFDVLHIEKGKSKEALCVPMQQIARVFIEHGDYLSNKDYDMIMDVFPENLSDIYNPRFADNVKYFFNEDKFSENRLGYLSLWVRLFFQYPSDYFSAFLSNNMGYWYTDAISPDPYSDRKLIETYTWEYDVYPIQRDSKIPFLERFYDSIALDSKMQTVPVVDSLFSTGFPIWFVFICMMILIMKKNKLFVTMILLMTFWFTLMAGPVVNGRYIYPLFVLFPIYVSLAFFTPNQKCVKN